MTSNYISFKSIEAKAIRFLEKYHPEQSIPIPIEEIIEIQLGIRVIPSPGLLRNFGIDAFSIHGLNEIYIDKAQYMDRETRARFTLAHEIGHHILHIDFLNQMTYQNNEQWKKFILNDIKRDPLETQANIFAGFLLMPTEKIKDAFEKEKSKLVESNEFSGNIPSNLTLAPYLANPLSRQFEVSSESMAYRIENLLKNP